MKRTKITKKIVIYSKEGDIIKEVDVTNIPWIMIYPRAVEILSSSLYGYKWKVIVEPVEIETNDKG